MGDVRGVLRAVRARPARRHGPRRRTWPPTCAGVLPQALDENGPHVDFPVCGGGLLALGAWDLTGGVGDAETSLRMIALGQRFGYHRTLPTMAWANVLQVLASVDPAYPARVEALVAEYACPPRSRAAGRGAGVGVGLRAVGVAGPGNAAFARLSGPARVHAPRQPRICAVRPRRPAPPARPTTRSTSPAGTPAPTTARTLRPRRHRRALPSRPPRSRRPRWRGHAPRRRRARPGSPARTPAASPAACPRGRTRWTGTSAGT